MVSGSDRPSAQFKPSLGPWIIKNTVAVSLTVFQPSTEELENCPRCLSSLFKGKNWFLYFKAFNRSILEPTTDLTFLSCPLVVQLLPSGCNFFAALLLQQKSLLSSIQRDFWSICNQQKEKKSLLGVNDQSSVFPPLIPGTSSVRSSKANLKII